MVWSIVQQIGRQASTIGVLLVLAVLLKPSDFGIVGLSATWTAFIAVFSELGFGSALIQRKEADDRWFSTVFYLNVVTGIALTAAGIALSWPCAAFFGVPEVQPVMACTSVCFLLNAFSLSQIALLQKQLRFRPLALRDIGASLIGGSAGILCAFLDFGYWSMVIQALVTSAVGTALIWISFPWRPKFSEFSLGFAAQLWPYSSKMLLFGVMKYWAQNIDKVLVGCLLGPVAMGYYLLAYRVILVPVDSIVGAVGNYLFPKFSRIQDDAGSIREAFRFICRASNTVILPLLVIAALTAHLFLPALIGEKWMPAVPLIRMMCVVAVAHYLISPVGQLMKALNRPGWLVLWSFGMTAATAGAVWGGALLGVRGVAFGLAVAHMFAVPVAFRIAARLIPLNDCDVVDALLPSSAAALVAGLALAMMIQADILVEGWEIALLPILSFVLYTTIQSVLDRSFRGEFLRRLVGK